jgi:uncharacterized membrane protein YphA (DoxX/SURF4 family)
MLKTVAYWVTTGVVVFIMASGGVADLVRPQGVVEGMAHLGYPSYFVALLGFWKVLGSIALVVPRFPRLKEWAYAGIFFDLTGAAVSHAASHDAAWHIVATAGFAIVSLVSWALRPQSRRL